jgi:hypothetical protein
MINFSLSLVSGHKKTRRFAAGWKTGLLLPSALLVTIGLQTLAALVLVHLQTTLLLKIAHGM